MPQRLCTVSMLHNSAEEVRERRKEIEAALDGHDPEEGYEWPDPEPRERVKAEGE